MKDADYVAFDLVDHDIGRSRHNKFASARNPTDTIEPRMVDKLVDGIDNSLFQPRGCVGIPFGDVIDLPLAATRSRKQPFEPHRFRIAAARRSSSAFLTSHSALTCWCGTHSAFGS